jgi:hypothetical protein
MARAVSRLLAVLAAIIFVTFGIIGSTAVPSAAATTATWHADDRLPHTAPLRVGDASASNVAVGRRPLGPPGSPQRSTWKPPSVVAAEDGPNLVAIGENMEERVQPYADRMGADTYQPDPSAPREAWEQNQRDWINKQMDDGRVIHDVGPDPARPNYPGISSKWYQTERDEIARRGYPTTPISLE